MIEFQGTSAQIRIELQIRVPRFNSGRGLQTLRSIFPSNPLRWTICAPAIAAALAKPGSEILRSPDDASSATG